MDSGAGNDPSTPLTETQQIAFAHMWEQDAQEADEYDGYDFDLY